jgi:serine/threonine-protein kinase HipA
VIFNYLIGNHDAHGKNFSLLIHEDGGMSFARLYDLVSTVAYPELSKKMAMKIGGEYESENITPRNFEKFADEAGLAKPIVRERVPELAAEVIKGLERLEGKIPQTEKVAKLIEERCRQTIAEFA